MTDPGNLRQSMFEPGAVAIVGASDEVGKIAARPLQFLIRHGFAGDIFPVNARRQTVLGRQAYPSVSALPREVDQAYIVLPTDAVMLAVEDCVRNGVKAVSVLADGFAETGETGKALQQRLVGIIANSDCRLIGPNSLGLVRTWNGLSMTANAAFAHDSLNRGGATVLSQSGSLMGTFVSRGRQRGFGFSNLVSVGNEADLSVGEIGLSLIDDKKTDCFLLFLETIRHGDTLEAFARAAYAAGKPVLAYKLGRSNIGAELAVSHTGALIGSDAAADAFLRDIGIPRVGVFEALFEAAPLFRAKRNVEAEPGNRKPHVTMLTTTGGGAAMVADQLGLSGVDVEGVDDTSRAALETQGITIKPGRIADLTLTGTRYKTVRAIIDQLLVSAGTKLIVSVIGSSAEFFPQQTVAPIIDAVSAAAPGHPPIAVFLVPQAGEAMTMLAAAGIACFRTPESCAEAIRVWLQSRPPRTQLKAVLPPLAARLIAEKGSGWTETQALALISACGVATANQFTVTVDDILLRRPLPDGVVFPLVAKLVSSDLPHKTDAGAVTLGIGSLDGLCAATRQMLASAHAYAPQARIRYVLLQQQLESVGEVLVGLQRDPSVGPVITVGVGGIATELYREIALRLAPVSVDEAREMIEAVKALRLLRGFRGRPHGDIDALAEAVACFSQLAAESTIVEAEINPLLVLPVGQGVAAVDGLFAFM